MLGLLSRWDSHNQRVAERAMKARIEKPKGYDTAVAMLSGSAAVEIGAITLPIGIGVLVAGAGWQRLYGIPILLVGGACMWSLAHDVVEVVRKRRRRA